jgi:cell division protein FtsN
VSHRIRRQPSIFSARWFRMCLGAGVAVALVLLIGPWIAGWRGSELPRSVFRLAPWSSEVKAKTAQARSAEPAIEKPAFAKANLEKPPPDTPALAKPNASTSPPAAAAPRGTAAATAKPASPAESQVASGSRVAASGPSPATPPKAAAPTAQATPPLETSRAGASVEGATPRPGALAAPPAVYWVQVGAFLEHHNADKLAERLRGEGLPAATTAFEQSRVLYRVLLAGPEGGPVPGDAVERVKGLGHTVEATAEGPAVTGSVPLRKAVETSHSLRQQGVQVRLKQEVSSSTYRVVRVGSFPTVAEAEAALATLTSKGVEGIVVRER